MTPYFSTDARRAALWTCAKSWEGTPFFAHAASKGHGVDCVRLAEAILHECGAIPALTLPAYALDHALHSTRTQLLRFMLDEPLLENRIIFVPLADVRPGDIYGLRSGRLDHHVGLALPWAKVVHAIEGRGVVIHNADDPPFAKRVLYCLRVMELTK